MNISFKRFCPPQQCGDIQTDGSISTCSFLKLISWVNTYCVKLCT